MKFWIFNECCLHKKSTK